jgi:hypothetical protein
LHRPLAGGARGAAALLREALSRLSNQVLRSEVTAMQSTLGARPFNLGGKAGRS